MSQPSIRRSFREEQGRRVYELEKGDRRITVEETSDPRVLSVRRDEKPTDQTADEFTEVLTPLVAHFVRYGNLPLPDAPRE